jgi:hypothetical protein
MKKNFDAKITFDNGDILYSRFYQQAPEEVAEYYYGRKFNLGMDSDKMQICTKIEFIYFDEE